MKKWKVFLLVGAMTMGLNLFKFLDWIAAIGSLLAGASAAKGAFTKPEEQEYGPSEGYSGPSRFMPGNRPRPLPQYDPRTRQPQSESPLMSYLQRFTQSRY